MGLLSFVMLIRSRADSLGLSRKAFRAEAWRHTLSCGMGVSAMPAQPVHCRPSNKPPISARPIFLPNELTRPTVAVVLSPDLSTLLTAQHPASRIRQLVGRDFRPSKEITFRCSARHVEITYSSAALHCFL